MIIINMQNKLYTIQCLTTNCIASPRAAIMEPAGFPELMNFTELSKLMEKSELTEMFKLMEREDFCPPVNPDL